jgi:hypothetical protein
VDNGEEAPRILGRDAYADDHEYEAELIATFIFRRVSRFDEAAPSAGKAVDPADPASRVERSLQRPGR